MRCIRADLGCDERDLNIYIFGDIHLGSNKCNTKEVMARVEQVKNDPNGYAILIGDIINNSTKTSVGDCYSEPLSPMEQISLAVRIFEPIKDKILGVTTGNHERRSYKTDGLDIMQFFCAQLGIADKYDYAGCLLFIRFGRLNTRAKGGSHGSTHNHCYTLYMSHGDGQGGKTVGGKANGLQKRGHVVDADIVVTGHTHQAIVFTEGAFKVDAQHSTVTQQVRTFVNIPSGIGYEEYAEIVGMTPSANTHPVIHLGGTAGKDDHKVLVTMG